MTRGLLTAGMVLLIGCGGVASDELDEPSEEAKQCPASFEMYGWRCGDHLEALHDAGQDTGAMTWCEGDAVMSCGLACASCNGESRCDAQPYPGQPCEWGCRDDLRGNASCNEEPSEQPCSAATCTSGISCTLHVEGTGTCDQQPVGGSCSCSDGVWSCWEGCPEDCPESAPAEGDPCAHEGLECRYFNDGTLNCVDGKWKF